MGQDTGIQWTDATWNPIRGCSRVSSGCVNCYAESVAARFSGPGQPYEGLVTIGSHWPPGPPKRPRWNGEIRIVREHFDDPLRWRRPRRIFVNSMSDLFHPNIPDPVVEELFAVMETADHHQFQILTKRPERAAEYFRRRFPPSANVWIGTSVEDQESADRRIPFLREISASVRFVSYEPALGPLVLGELASAVDWLICGGESGPRARPCAVEWLREARDEAVAFGIPVFMKQLGANSTETITDSDERRILKFGVPGQKNDDPAIWSDLSRREWPTPRVRP